jgi:SAM-dependent methyltransferase
MVAAPRWKVSGDAADAYLERTPLGHTLFRMAEIAALGGVEIEAPVLEIGCGAGQFARCALEGTVDAGVDLSARALRRARACGRYRRLERADARRLPFNAGEFRTVLSISVLEHAPGPREIVAEMFRVLAPGGAAAVTIVLDDLHRHLLYPRWFARLGLPSLARCYRAAQDRAFGHVTLLPAADWEAMFREAGFRLELSRRCVSPRAAAWWDAILPLALPYRLADRLGLRIVWRPQWLRRAFARWIDRLLSLEDGQAGACLALVARKPEQGPPGPVRPRAADDCPVAAAPEECIIALGS